MISRKEKEYGTYIYPLVQPNTAIRKLQIGVRIRAHVTAPASLWSSTAQRAAFCRNFCEKSKKVSQGYIYTE